MGGCATLVEAAAGPAPARTPALSLGAASSYGRTGQADPSGHERRGRSGVDEIHRIFHSIRQRDAAGGLRREGDADAGGAGRVAAGTVPQMPLGSARRELGETELDSGAPARTRHSAGAPVKWPRCGQNRGELTARRPAGRAVGQPSIWSGSRLPAVQIYFFFLAGAFLAGTFFRGLAAFLGAGLAAVFGEAFLTAFFMAFFTAFFTTTAFFTATAFLAGAAFFKAFLGAACTGFLAVFPAAAWTAFLTADLAAGLAAGFAALAAGAGAAGLTAAFLTGGRLAAGFATAGFGAGGVAAGLGL